MKRIGGFLGLEPNYGKHPGSLLLSIGRACLNLIFQKKKIKKLYIPHYTCDSIFEPILFNRVKFEYYSIDNNLDPKILNLSDGAYLFSPLKIINNFKRNNNISLKHLIDNNSKSSYKNFLFNESLLGLNIEKVSKISESILRNINYNKIANIRNRNFIYLESHLKHINKLKISIKKDTVPLCYPLLLDKIIDKNNFHSKNLLIPTFWERKIKTIKSGFSFEKELPKKLIPIPIDQRYSLKEMKKIIHTLYEFI